MQSLNLPTRRGLLSVFTGGLTAFTLAGAALLTGCGGGTSDSGTASNSNNSGTVSTTTAGTTPGTTSTSGTTNTGTTTGGTTTGGTTTGGVVTGSGEIHIVVSNASNSNVNSANFDSVAPTISTLLDQGVGQALAVTANVTNGANGRSVSLSVLGKPSLMSGQSLRLEPGSGRDGGVDYIEVNTSGASKLWMSFSGSVVIDSVQGKNIKLRLIDVGMRPSFSPSTGSFTLNGTMDVTAK